MRLIVSGGAPLSSSVEEYLVVALSVPVLQVRVGPSSSVRFCLAPGDIAFDAAAYASVPELVWYNTELVVMHEGLRSTSGYDCPERCLLMLIQSELSLTSLPTLAAIHLLRLLGH